MSNSPLGARIRATVAIAVVALAAGHLTVGLGGQAATSLFTYSSTIGTSTGSAQGELSLPVGLAVGPLDRIYVADTGNERIQIFNADGTFYAGFGTPGDPDSLDDGPMELNYPSGIVVDENGKILVVESDNHRMQLFERDLNVTGSIQFKRVKSFGSYGNYDVLDEVNRDPDTGDYIGLAPTLTGLNFPTRAAIRPGTRLGDDTDDLGRVALVDSSNHRVIVLDSMLNPLFAFGTYADGGNAPGNMEVPWGVGMDLTRIYVTDWANHRTETFSYTGQILSGFGSVGLANSPGATERPFDVQPDGQGHLIVADRNRSRVLFLTPDPATTLPLCSDEEVTRCSIVSTPAGTKYDALVIGGFTATGQELGKFSHPQAVAMDSKRRLLVLDTEGHRVVIFRVAQISASASVSSGVVQSGETVTLTVEVKSDGADPITVAPLVTANLAGSLTTPGSVVLNSGPPTSFSLPFVSDATGQLTFTVRASGTPAVGSPIFSPTVTAGPVTVNPAPGPKMSVTVTAPARVGLSATIPVQVSVSNTGTSALTSVLPFVNVPPGSGVTLASSPAVVSASLLPGAAPRIYNFTYTATAVGNVTFTGRATAGDVLPLGPLPTATTTIDSDVDAPATTIVSILPAAVASGWYLQPVTVTLSASDATAVQAIKYSVTGQIGFSGQALGPAATVVTTVTVPYDGGNKLTYFAEDTKQNVEAPHKLALDIDSVPPAIVKGGVKPSANTAGWINTYPTVRFEASDGGSGVAFVTPPVLVSPPLYPEGAGIVVTGTARDIAGHSATTDVIVNVDTVKPTFTCSAGGPKVWPPNHKMVEWKPVVSVSDATSGLGDATFKLVDFYSSEAANAKGSGNTAVDMSEWELEKPDTIGKVRVERSGKGIGRTYTLVYMATDLAGNNAQCTVSLTVPHDQGKKK